MHLHDLNADVRRIMSQEIQHDIDNGGMFISPRLNSMRSLNYVQLLRSAALAGSVQWLARELENGGYLLKNRERHRHNGELTIIPPAFEIAKNIAQNDFNRFYIRALCIYVITNESGQTLVLYHSQGMNSKLPIMPTWVGRRMSPDLLLANLREDPNIASALGVPAIHGSFAMVRISDLDKN